MNFDWLYLNCNSKQMLKTRLFSFNEIAPTKKKKKPNLIG
jgi:hypothetical protein